MLLGFQAGGYFADTTGWVAAGLAVALAVSLAVRGRSSHAPTVPLVVAAAALTLLALWTLASGIWSDSWGRALVEFDRVLLYLLALLLFAGARSPRWTLRRLPVAVALAALVLCGSGVVVLTLPDSWPFELPPTNMRLEYPLGYENALGALAAIGFVMALHVASWRYEHPLVRVAAAASLPLLAATLILTFSRGALLAGIAGVAVYLVLGFSRGALVAVLAAALPVGLAAGGALDADLLGSALSRSPAALEQGEDLAVLVGWGMIAAAVLRAVLTPLESRLPTVSIATGRPRLLAALGAAALVAAGIAVLATAGPGTIDELGERLDGGGGNGDQPEGERRARDRLGTISVSGQSRSEYWRVALDAFEAAPLRGSGAGTYAKHWARDRPIDEDVAEAHSLFLQSLAELGLVGTALLLVVLVSAFAPFVAGLRRRSRPLSAAFLGAGAVWVLHSGLDWDWEMPVLNLWLFAAAGCALAASPRAVRAGWLERRPARIALAVLCLLLAVTPASVAFAQWRLDKAHAAFLERNCDEARREADRAIAANASRPEAYALLAYCAARAGDHRVALSRMEEALDRDPGNWELVYGMALVRGAAGLDPRPAAREARRLNPKDELTRAGSNRLTTDRPRVWRREATTLPLPILIEPDGRP